MSNIRDQIKLLRLHLVKRRETDGIPYNGMGDRRNMRED